MDLVTGATRAWAAHHGLVVAEEPYADDDDPGAATAAGHRAATRALAALGGPRLGLGRLADRRPAWPDGYTGSIGHSGGLAVAALAEATRARAVGVDVELRRGLPFADAGVVLSAGELARAAGAADPDDAATTMWSVKEAAFRAWDEAGGGALPTVDPREHIRVEVPADGAEGRVRAVPLGALSGAAPAEGHLWHSAGRVLVIVVLPPVPRRRP